MIYLYCRQRCTSSLKAIQWLKKYGLEVSVRSCSQISRKELITVLASTDKGISDIVKHPNRLSDEEMAKFRLIKTMTLNHALDYIKANPNLLKSPIIIEDHKVLIGYNPDQIRMFLPRVYRRKSLFKNILK